MTAVVVTIAEAVKTMLAEAATNNQFVLAFEPKRSYADPAKPLEDSGLHVDVMAHATEQEIELASRGEMDFIVPVVVHVRKLLKQGNTSQGEFKLPDVDALVELMEQIHWLFRPQNFENFTAGEWLDTKLQFNPSIGWLRKHSQFWSSIKLTFKHTKEA